MTSLSRICFSAALAVQAVAATVSGSVQLVDSRVSNVRHKSDYSGVVVWLDRPGAPAAGDWTVKIVQKQKRFVPHIVAIPVGSTVDFPNLDPIFHNAFSNFAAQPFDVGLYPPGTTQKVRFVREGVARVFCNIHPSMSAVIVVVPTRYIAISVQGGGFSIPGVEPGEYRMRVFHERSSEKTLRGLERRVTVDQPAVLLPLITVSESGYIETPHKNKYGGDYPPVIEDRQIYPAGRNQ